MFPKSRVSKDKRLTKTLRLRNSNEALKNEKNRTTETNGVWRFASKSLTSPERTTGAFASSNQLEKRLVEYAFMENMKKQCILFIMNMK